MAVMSATTGMTYILIINEAIWMGDLLDHSLTNPNQLRYHGVNVQDNPFGAIAMPTAKGGDDFIHPMQANGTTNVLRLQNSDQSRFGNLPACRPFFTS
jgi:hypothetical protein